MDGTEMPADESEIYEDSGNSWVVEREVFTVETTEPVTENLAETPMPVWSPEYFQYELTDTGLNVYKTLNVLGDRGELHQQLNVDIKTPSENIKDIVTTLDYNGDSYFDIAVRTYVDDKNTYYRYFRYNPETDYLEEWQELDGLEYFVSPYGNGLSVFHKINDYDSETSTYIWENDIPVLISKEKQYLDEGLVFRDFLEYDSSGNETLVKHELLVYDEDGRLISVTEEEKPAESGETEPVYTEISDNIKLYDLQRSENSELIPAEKTLYLKDIEMAGYGILSNSDGNIKLIKDNGEANIIVESLYPDDAYSWVRTEFPVDSDRFVYSACGEWGNTGFGVYDLKSGENHFIMESCYPKVIKGNSLILSRAKYSTVTAGYAEFDLDSYEIRDIPLQIDLESLKYYKTNSVSPDGRLSAVMKHEDDSYIITVISLESGEVAEEYILKTADTYGNMELEFASADTLHLYAKRIEDNTFHLYVFDIA